MVDFIKRDKNDLFDKPLLGFLFKNRTFLMTLRVVVAAFFFYALYFGFAHPGKENIFTGALFWGIFWALFMVATLPSFGRIFCGICPHGFFGKYITKLGLKKTMPKWMQNRYIGILLLVIGWWGIYYTFPSFWKSPLATAAMFSGMTLLAFLFYYLYKEMSYCKYICPIGTLTRAYDKLSFTKLETYTDSCSECRTFECASACPYNLKPFSFAKKNQADDCTLCMECAGACEAVKFSITKPSEQLFSKFKTLNAEVWTYILILGSIPISMSFAHGLNRTNIADTMIWNRTAEYFGMSEYAGGFAFGYALLLTVFFSMLGLFLASKTLKKEYSTTFSTLGYGYAPLFILGSLGHTLGSFFTHDYQEIVTGFAQAFGFVAEVSPLAHRGDGWLGYFGLLKWIGVVWAFILIYKRLKLIEASRVRKIFGYVFASLLIFFFIGLNAYSGYVFKTYGAKQGGHGSHGAKSTMHGGTNRAKPAATAEWPAVKLKDDAPIYFTLSDPAQKAKAYGGGMGSHGAGGKGAVPTKKSWLAYGDDLKEKRTVPATDIEVFYYDTEQNLKDAKVDHPLSGAAYIFEVPRNGYYTIYAKNELVRDGKLFYKVAKLEYLNGRHGSEERYTQEVKRALYTDRTKIDLLRIKNDREESFFYRHAMGDELAFQALFKNSPLVDAEITVSTGSGWVKKIRTDEKGIARFTIIRDYFPEWNAFDKRHQGELLVTLTHAPRADETYILTYPVYFYPNSSDYESYGYALMLITLAFLISGTVVYRFRRNRTKPFSELRYEA
ncbi:4Fe-4S binding protein [Sulfurimonas sp. HSL3-7]|uniref:4Fe-4S binding protein n=1 Tax=Sulfonitrofixus jiaomeiensis TaxID=3131938 RepID=UPI0031F8E377